MAKKQRRRAKRPKRPPSPFKTSAELRRFRGVDAKQARHVTSLTPDRQKAFGFKDRDVEITRSRGGRVTHTGQSRRRPSMTGGKRLSTGNRPGKRFTSRTGGKR